MRKLAILGLLALLGLTGCASGRYRGALIDLDLRTPEQIRAYEREATAVYARTPPKNTEAVAPAAKTAWWVPAFDFLQIMEDRIRILSFEAGFDDVKEDSLKH